MPVRALKQKGRAPGSFADNAAFPNPWALQDRREIYDFRLRVMYLCLLISPENFTEWREQKRATRAHSRKMANVQ